MWWQVQAIWSGITTVCVLQHVTKEIEEACEVPNLEHFNGWMWRRSWDRRVIVVCVCVCVTQHSLVAKASAF